MPSPASSDRAADDWRPLSPDGTSSAEFCTGCGASGASCAGCARPFDPPRFCPACGKRLAVAVHPGGFRARCRAHGEVVAG